MIGTFDTLLDEEEGEGTEEMHEGVAKLTEELEDMTPKVLIGHIRDLVLAGRRSRRHRSAFRKGDLKALATWERELTNGYGVENGKK